MRIKVHISVNTCFRGKIFIVRRDLMENVVIGSATYVISRVFVGTQSVSDLIQKQIEASSAQFLPLTDLASASYNQGGNNAGLRRNHAN